MLNRRKYSELSARYWWVYSEMGPIMRVELYSTRYTIAEVVEPLIMLVRDRARATYNRFQSHLFTRIAAATQRAKNRASSAVDMTTGEPEKSSNRSSSCMNASIAAHVACMNSNPRT